jgi:hypothetical protein
VTTPAVLWLWLAASAALASTDDVSATLDRLGDADLVLMNDPSAARPVRVLVATRVAASDERLRQVLLDVASYRKAMPAFRRTDIVARRSRAAGATDLEIGWELEVPAWNLSGKLWLRPDPQGATLELAQGDFAPGLFHLRAIPAPSEAAQKGDRAVSKKRSILIVDGHANLGDANWAIRKMVRRSTMVEPVMTAAAAYVMAKALQGLAEAGSHSRPRGAMAAPDIAALDGSGTGRAANALVTSAKVIAAIRRHASGRLAQVEVALSAAGAPEDVSGRSLHPSAFRELPGWKKVTPTSAYPNECRGGATTCWAVETNLPFFSVGGTWKIAPQPWRARMVAGDTAGAVLALDFLPGRDKGRTTVVMSQHSRMDQAGFFPRKLIEAEPFLEHGLALALAVVEAVSLVPALERM